MDKEEILQKSRTENAAGYMDERERGLRLQEDSFALGCGLLLALAFRWVIRRSGSEGGEG